MAMTDDFKRRAALAALDELPPEGVIGLGTGSTARLFIAALGELVASGRRYTCVATSEASRRQAEQLGIEVLPDEDAWDIAVTVDGADEVSDALDLIKGGGGAHTREKIVNFNSRRNVIIVDSSKLSHQLGENWPVPVEVLPFGHRALRAHLEQLGTPVFRMAGRVPARTDTGNMLYDLACGPIHDPAALDAALHAIPGVVETGLFVRRADLVLVASETGIERRERPDRASH
jgi:ribose 5-phosphate isomerase A